MRAKKAFSLLHQGKDGETPRCEESPNCGSSDQTALFSSSLGLALG